MFNHTGSGNNQTLKTKGNFTFPHPSLRDTGVFRSSIMMLYLNVTLMITKALLQSQNKNKTGSHDSMQLYKTTYMHTGVQLHRVNDIKKHME